MAGAASELLACASPTLLPPPPVLRSQNSYTLFMEKAAQQPYAVLATVHWAIERWCD